MSSLDVIRGYAEPLEKLLRLGTYPIGIKFFEREADVPQDAVRPTEAYGYRMLACQAFAMSRRAGATIVQTMEETWCSEGAVGYGLIPPIDYFMEGNTRYPRIVSTREGAELWAREFPRFEYGKYRAVVSAPLSRVSFEPDVVVIYCNSAQLGQLVFARTWLDGRDIQCRIAAQGACVHATVPVVLKGECQVAIPCLGDRGFAFTQDDEIIFSAPMAKVEGLITALKAMDEIGAKYPVIPRMPREPEMPPSYTEMARLSGMIKSPDKPDE
jgi:uncharacterized protein (DUF169 family)